MKWAVYHYRGIKVFTCNTEEEAKAWIARQGNPSEFYREVL